MREYVRNNMNRTATRLAYVIRTALKEQGYTNRMVSVSVDSKLTECEGGWCWPAMIMGYVVVTCKGKYAEDEHFEKVNKIVEDFKDKFNWMDSENEALALNQYIATPMVLKDEFYYGVY